MTKDRGQAMRFHDLTWPLLREVPRDAAVVVAPVAACEQHSRQLPAASYWEIAEKELAALAEGPRKTMGHACEFETSMVLALRPDLVRRDEVRDDPPPSEPALRGLYVAEDMRQRTRQGAVGFP